jgi:hypothetical protein
MPLTPEEYESIRKQVDTEFGCSHPGARVAFKDSSGGRRLFYKQCVRCFSHKVVRKAELSQFQILSAVPLDEGQERAWHAAKWDRYKALTEQAEQARDARWQAWYSAYLLTPEWRARRAKVLKRAGGVCEGCLGRPATQVHHLTYERVGREMLFDLVAICDDCHGAIHEKTT